MTKFFESSAVRQDTLARTLSYFSTGPNPKITAEIIEELVELSSKKSENARLSLHTAPEDAFHEMLIVERPAARYYRPHKHLVKGESWHVLRGTMGILFFDDQGIITDSFKLQPNGIIHSRCATGQWHTVLPLSEHVVYLESKPGPFLPDGDSVMAPWSPDGSNKQEAASYIEEFVRRFPS